MPTKGTRAITPEMWVLSDNSADGKCCPTCGKRKELRGFPDYPTSKKNATCCRACGSARTKQWYAAHPGRQRETFTAGRSTLTGRARHLLSNARERCKRYGLPPPTITEEWISARIREQNSCCSLTGRPFDFNSGVGIGKPNPFVPSLDQMVSRAGYDGVNTRVVCWDINKAIGEWGEPAYRHMNRAYLMRWDEEHAEEAALEIEHLRNSVTEQKRLHALALPGILADALKRAVQKQGEKENHAEA